MRNCETTVRIRPFTIGALLATALVCSGLPCHGSEPKDGFPEPQDTQPAPMGVTTAKAALAALHLPTGFQATLFASEPDLRQPIALATDHRVRLWVAENYSYAQREVNFDTKLRDRIVILEDKDHDGRFD